MQYRECMETTKKKCDNSWREFKPHEFNTLKKSIETVYRQTHEIIVMKSANNNNANNNAMNKSLSDSMNDCLDCQLLKYYQADIIIGLHGAGMTNIMFMKPNSLLIEIIGKFDGRMLPFCGYHNPYAAIFGIHHYIYYWDWKSGEILNTDQLAYESFLFYNEMKIKI